MFSSGQATLMDQILHSDDSEYCKDEEVVPSRICCFALPKLHRQFCFKVEYDFIHYLLCIDKAT